MATFYCPTCGANLRKRKAISKLVPWWRYVSANYWNAAGYQCNHCKAILRKAVWRWDLFSKITIFLVGMSISFLLKSLHHNVDYFITMTFLAVNIPSLIEYFFSKRPLYVFQNVQDINLVGRT